MKINLKPLYYILGFTTFLVICFNINYDMTKNFLLALGILSAYVYVFALSNKKKVKEKETPPYVD